MDHPAHPDSVNRRNEIVELAKEQEIDLFSFDEEVKEAIKWAAGLSERPPYPLATTNTTAKMLSGQTYESVICDIAKEGEVQPYLFGFACSILPSYRRKTKKSLSNHVGVAGQKYDGEGVVIRTKEMQTMIRTAPVPGAPPGTTTALPAAVWLIAVTDDSGNEISWWDRGPSAGTTAIGDRIKFSGIVKKHDVFMGTKQTTLNRVKWERI